jgi:JAB1/Mov34/MPN/PAD-1 ubiquitin protease
MSNLWFGEIEEYSCEIHPVVPLMIIQHFLRKQNSQPNCMGLLLGTITEGLVQIGQVLPLNYFSTEENKVAIRQFGEGLKAQYNLLREAYPKYSLVGIYTLSDLHSRFIPILQRIEKDFGINNLLLYKFKLTPEGIESQCYLLMRFRIETLAVFKPVPTKILQAPLNILLKNDQNLGEIAKSLKQHTRAKPLDTEVSLLFGKSILDSKNKESQKSDSIDLSLKASKLAKDQVDLSDKINYIL